jgi:hypothetical protein
MKKLLLASVTLVALTSAANACKPAPSCWIEESPSYLRSICKQYVKGPIAQKPLVETMDDPDEYPALVKACRKLGNAIQGQRK